MINFKPGLNIITGLNKSGKSHLVQYAWGKYADNGVYVSNDGCIYAYDISYVYKRPLTMFYFLLEKNRNYKTVIIDDVEQGLDPIAQSRVLPDLATKYGDKRYVISTMSPMVLMSLRNVWDDKQDQLIVMPGNSVEDYFRGSIGDWMEFFKQLMC